MQGNLFITFTPQLVKSHENGTIFVKITYFMKIYDFSEMGAFGPQKHLRGEMGPETINIPQV